MGSELINPGYTIRPATPDDARGMQELYAPYVSNSLATFEEVVPSEADLRSRLVASRRGNYPWCVATTKNGSILGYAYAKRFHQRSAYRHTFEWSIYLTRESRRTGLSTALFEAVLTSSREQQCRSLVAVLSCPNPESAPQYLDDYSRTRNFHSRIGFIFSGRLCKVGSKFGLWHDIIYMQLSL